MGTSWLGNNLNAPAISISPLKVAHDGFRLNVKIAEHFVAAPSSNETNCVSVNVHTQQGHCPPPARSDRAEMSFARKPSDGPRAVLAVRGIVVMSVGAL